MPVAPPLPWVRAALCAGLIAGVLGSAALALGYALVNPEVPPFHSWPASVAAILLSGTVSGATLGVTISGGMVVARRRGGGTVREVFGAAGGAVVGGLVPSAIGVLGFGSLSTPYIGTDIAAVGVLVAALILGTLLSLPAATGRVRTISRGATLACSALASVLVIIPFGLTVAGIAVAELPLPVIRRILHALHNGGGDTALVLGAFSIGLAVVFGAIMGGFIGVVSDVAGLLRKFWSSTSRAHSNSAREVSV